MSANRFLFYQPQLVFMVQRIPFSLLTLTMGLLFQIQHRQPFTTPHVYSFHANQLMRFQMDLILNSCAS